MNKAVLNRLKNAFITGLLVLMPLGITFFVAQFLLEKIGKPASALFFAPWSSFLDTQWIGWLAEVIAVLIVVLLITAFGWLSNFFFGRLCLALTERFIKKIPFISTVYNTVKQIADTMGKNKKAVFQKAVLVHFPSDSLYSVGFLTNRANGETQDKTKENVCNVFVPTTPNPTSGFLIMVPEEKLVVLDMSVGDAIKLIISGGAVIPEKLGVKADQRSKKAPID